MSSNLNTKNKIFMAVAIISICAFLLGFFNVIDLSSNYATAAEKTTRDRLVGLFITEDYINTFDMETYLKDNISKLTGDTIEVSDISAYQNKLYGTPVYDEHGISGYNFNDLEGYLLIFTTFTGEQGEYNTSIINGPIGNCSVHFSGGYESSAVSAEGTFLISAYSGSICLYLNEVYQEPSGDVYLVSGMGSYMETNYIGSSVTSNRSSETKYNNNGNIFDYKIDLTVHMEVKEKPDSYKVLEYDRNHLLLKSTVLCSDNVANVADTFYPDDNTSYIIVESKISTDDGIKYNYELYTKEDSNLSIITVYSEHLLSDYSIYIEWK